MYHNILCTTESYRPVATIMSSDTDVTRDQDEGIEDV